MKRITPTHICSPQIDMDKNLEYKHMEKCKSYNCSGKLSSTSVIDMSIFDQKYILVIESVETSLKRKYFIKEDVFGRHTSFHSNKVILKLNVKQHLSLPCISPLGDLLLKNTYNFFVLTSFFSS